jgi:transposase
MPVAPLKRSSSHKRKTSKNKRRKSEERRWQLMKDDKFSLTEEQIRKLADGSSFGRGID